MQPFSETFESTRDNSPQPHGIATAESARKDRLPATSPSSGYVIYEGNGATSQNYETEFEARGIRGYHSSSGSGARKHIALQPVTDHDGTTLVINGFVHEDAKCVGFYARQKIDGTWIWLTEDLTWQTGSADITKMLVQPGRDISALGPAESTNIVLEAQWADANGKSANCGSAMFSNKLMAHAFGGFKQASYHNTSVAFKYSVEAGHSYFEVDLSYTSDERLVCSSPRFKSTDAAEPEAVSGMPYQQFMSLTKYGEPVMDARQLYELIRSYPQFRFEIDFHFVEGESVTKRIRSLLTDFEHDANVLNRLLIQVYSAQMHADIDSVYHFEHYQYLVGMKMDRLSEAITYSLDTGVCALALRAGLATPGVINEVKSAGLFILTYTVATDAALADALLRSGIDTVCTDHVTPRSLRDAEGLIKQNQFFIFYHSGSPEADSQYQVTTAQLTLHRVKSGALEVRDSTPWKNDGAQRLLPQAFALPGHHFAGWRMRMKIDGKTKWYCSDGSFRTKKEALVAPPTVRRLFQEQEAVPVVSTVEGAKIVMVAEWLPARRFARIIQRWLPKRR